MMQSEDGGQQEGKYHPLIVGTTSRSAGTATGPEFAACARSTLLDGPFGGSPA